MLHTSTERPKVTESLLDCSSAENADLNPYWYSKNTIDNIIAVRLLFLSILPGRGPLPVRLGGAHIGPELWAQLPR